MPPATSIERPREHAFARFVFDPFQDSGQALLVCIEVLTFLVAAKRRLDAFLDRLRHRADTPPVEGQILLGLKLLRPWACREILPPFLQKMRLAVCRRTLNRWLPLRKRPPALKMDRCMAGC